MSTFVGTYFNEPVQRALETIGVDDPLKTTFFVAALASGAQFYFKPDLTFDEQGRARPWNLLANDGTVRPTSMPWYLASLSIGYLAGLVI